MVNRREVHQSLSVADPEEETRGREWYVPRWGPRRFRLVVGLSFLPYTAMNASYVVVGSLLSPIVHTDRLLGLTAVYLLAVGVSAHSLDALAPNKPWGEFLGKNQLVALAAAGLIPALSIGLYYALADAPLLLPVGVLELFFLVAYNLELFGGFFHTDFWFALSWGFLPVIAGFVAQADTINLVAVGGGLFGYCTAFVEISASRPYKVLKKQATESQLATKLESVLKGIVGTVVTVAAFLAILRLG